MAVPERAARVPAPRQHLALAVYGQRVPAARHLRAPGELASWRHRGTAADAPLLQARLEAAAAACSGLFDW